MFDPRTNVGRWKYDTSGMAQSKRHRVELFEVYKRIGIRFTLSNGTFPVVDTTPAR